MKSYQEFLTESVAPGVLNDKIGGKAFGLTTNDDGVYFQIGNERFQSSKATKAAILKVLKGGGTWQGAGGAGSKQAGISIDGATAYFKIGDETFILNTKARRELTAMFK